MRQAHRIGFTQVFFTMTATGIRDETAGRQGDDIVAGTDVCAGHQLDFITNDIRYEILSITDTFCCSQPDFSGCARIDLPDLEVADCGCERNVVRVVVGSGNYRFGQDGTRRVDRDAAVIGCQARQCQGVGFV